MIKSRGDKTQKDIRQSDRMSDNKTGGQTYRQIDKETNCQMGREADRLVSDYSNLSQIEDNMLTL